jgi:hypothetical protein
VPERLPAASPCPDLADLLLASEGELPRRRQTEVTSHLRLCATCRDQLGNAGLAIREYQDALPGPHATPTGAEADTRVERLDHFRLRLKQEQRAQSTRDSRLPVRQWLPVAAAVPLLVAAMFFSSRYTSVVRAEELLTRAVAQEQATAAGTVRRLQIQMKRTGTRFTRDVGAVSAVSIAQTAGDAELTRRLDASHLDWRDPLSVRAFRTWHDSLRVKTDSVASLGNDALALRTETTDGLLRSAELIVRRVDFQPLRATFSFEDLGDVEIVELSRWVSQAPLLAARSTAPVVVAEPAAPDAETLDEAELDVRAALHVAGVDGKPGITVTRTRRAVELRGRVDPNRKTEIARVLREAGPVRLLLRPEEPAAETAATGAAAPAVATDPSVEPLKRWLDRTFGPGDRAALFVPALTADADDVQRRTDAFAALAARYPESETLTLAAPAREKLDMLVEAHYRDLVKAVQVLDDRLALFLGTSTRRTPSIVPRPWQVSAAAMRAHAARLDQAIHTLLQEQDLPLPTDIGPGHDEPAAMSELRRAADALWAQLVSA